jgi:hypothetical protein
MIKEEYIEVDLEYCLDKFSEIILEMDELYKNRIIFHYSTNDVSEWLTVETKLPKKSNNFICSRKNITLDYIFKNLKILAIEYKKDTINEENLLVKQEYYRYKKLSEQ